MNPHYHPHTYGGAGTADLTPPHPPSPDSGPGAGPPPPSAAYLQHPSNGHHQLGAAHHLGHDPQPQQHQHPGAQQQQPPPAQHQFGPAHYHPAHLHHLNNNGGGGGPGPAPPSAGAVKVCAGCGGKIVERFLLHALDRYWHNGCLKCSCCGAMLADIGTSCFTKGGMILCKNDYMRLFGSSGACSACGQTIPASEFVMRAGAAGSSPGAQPQQQQQQAAAAAAGGAHVFHLKCFACSKCGSHLVPGDRYYMLAGALVCEQDWHKLLKGSAPAGAATVRKGKVGRPRRSRD